jgi:hypothetical protein
VLPPRPKKNNEHERIAATHSAQDTPANTNTVGWGNAAQNEPSFGGGSAQDGASVKAKTINLINSVRTLMRSEYTLHMFRISRTKT